MNVSYFVILMKTTISLPEDLLADGRKRAKRDNRSFSSYVQKLIQRDKDGELLDAATREEEVPTAADEKRRAA